MRLANSASLLASMLVASSAQGFHVAAFGSVSKCHACSANAAANRLSNLRLFAKKSHGASASNRAVPAAGMFWTSRDKCWRPDVQDVERISWGKPAKKKGTGSRGVPHRLNADERQIFEQARRKGMLEIGGSGWRKQRRDAPLLNTYRSLCDARGQACIVLHKGSTGEDDELVVDLSPLRLPDRFDEVATGCLAYSEVPGQVEAGVTPPSDGEAGDMGEIESEDEGDQPRAMPEEDPFESRPIYQLSPYNIAWTLSRSDAKSLGKKMALAFDTAEAKAPKTKKPQHVKPGKGRRHGGYGIG